MTQFPEQHYCRKYVGRAHPDLKGKMCRIINTWRGKAPHNVTVEFEDGFRVVCPMRCLRKVKDAHAQGDTL